MSDGWARQFAVEPAMVLGLPLGGRAFTEVEPELRRRWSHELRSPAGERGAVWA